MSTQLKSYKYVVTAVLWAMFTSALLLLPARDLDPVSNFEIPHLDKLVHFILFAVLTWLAQKACDERAYIIRPIVLGLVVTVYAVITECLQMYIDGRSCDIYDWIIDVLGIGLALLISKH